MKTWAMARFTLWEKIRSKTMIAGLVVSLFYLAIIPVLSTSSGSGAILGEVEKTAAGRDFLSFSLTGLNFIGMFMAIFTTLGTVHSEVERGTILTVIAKPLERWQLIIGKWLGHIMLMLAYVILMGLALWASVALDSGTMIWSFLPALLLVCLNVVTMVTLTMTFSVFLPIVANAIFVFLFLIITSNLRIFNIISEASNNIIITIFAGGLRLMLPVNEVSDLAGSLLRTKAAEAAMSAQPGFAIPRNWTFGYEIAYIGALILLSVWLFNRRDLV